MTDEPTLSAGLTVNIEFPELDDKAIARLTELVSDRSLEARSERMSILRRVPEAAARVGDMMRQLEVNLINDMDRGLLGDTIGLRCQDIRCQLGYDTATESERLLIDRIVVTWLHLSSVEVHRRTSVARDDCLERREWYDRHVSRAQADHLRAVTALARVRRRLVEIE